jgi:formylglycine-generating enzyme required for sulfatase activity
LIYHRSGQVVKGQAQSGKRRSSRGGAWRHQVKYNRCAARSSLNPSFQYNDYGFRVVTDAG